jgi:hypothetical protein
MLIYDSDRKLWEARKLIMVEFGRLLVIIGLVTALAGVLILVAVRYFPWLGNLPGDIRFERGNMSFYFPLATMLLISILGTILLNIVIRIFNR